MATELILIVDDDIRSVEFLRDSLLVPMGYTALCATNGEETPQLALTQKPELILLDLQMPKMDGLEVIEALQNPAMTFLASLAPHTAARTWLFRLFVWE